MNTSTPSVETILAQAVEIAAPAERQAFVEQACAGDTELQDRLERLIANHFQAGSFLERPAVAMDPDETTGWAAAGPAESPGTVIGPYKLLEAIGEGGMGVVYVAEQTEPVRRRVALKVIKPGMDSKQVVARFEAERQALAMMDHPNIAKVHDGGATESGRPYFVMELVRGIPITDYCDREQLSIPDRLELFVLVCRAVQHAHQKGVIHRDLKPSNVLVTVIDGVAVPKVIDFGVAKATGQALTDKTVYTGFDQFVGTPLYVSPEQAELSGVDVDTRSDIYSLGVLLYELLTGTTPIDSETLKRAAFNEMRRIIREEEPPRPSTRLSTLGERLSTVSAQRKADPRRLGSSVRGELDWVVMKALEKDRGRRYETANDFAADVMRYLADRPVEAIPPSAWYRFTKYARRNRTALTTATLLALALVLGTAVSVWQAVRATQAGTLAAIRERQARDAAAESKAVLDFLVKGMLEAAEPEQTLGRDVKVAEVLANAEAKVKTAFQGQPLVEAGVRHALAHAYHSLGRYGDARQHLSIALDLRRSHLGAEHPDTLASMALMFVLLHHLDKLEEACDLGERTLEAQRRVLGPEHPDTLDAMADFGDVLTSQAVFGSPLVEQERLDKAHGHYEKLLEVLRRVQGSEHRDTLKAMNGLGVVLLQQGRFDEARKLFEGTVEVLRRVLGPEHPGTLTAMDDLGFLLYRQGKFDGARRLHEQALEAGRRVLGPEHLQTLGTMNHLGLDLLGLGKLAEGSQIFEQASEISLRVLGPGQFCTYVNMQEATRFATRSADGSEASLGRAVNLARRFTTHYPKDERAWKELGLAEYRAGHWDAAIRAEERSIELRGGSGEAFIYLVLALSHARKGEMDEACDWFAKARPAVEAREGLRDTPRWLVDEAAELFGASPPGGQSKEKAANRPKEAISQ